MGLLSVFRGRRKKAIKKEGEKMAKTIQTATRRVVDALELCEGFPISNRDIANIAGVSKQRTAEIIESLKIDGFVEEHHLDDEWSSYQINQSPNLDKVSYQTVSVDGADYCESVEDDVWQFFRDTRSTDTLMFLVWLERKYSGRL